jgi:DNA invertase Pin-like site-specific DNA recombinase
MRSVIYTRISDDRTGARAGVERQESECRALAARLGWEVVTVCTDNSVSAYNGKHRPGFDHLTQLVRAREVEAIIAWGADRLTRHPRELEDLVDLLDQTGTRVQTVTSGEYDLTTSDGRAYARIVGAIARQESERKAERIKSQKAQATARGDRPGGPRAYGWTTGRQGVIPAEIAVIREMADRVLAGEGIATITRSLNGRGLRSAQGKPWARNTVRQLLINPATAGLRRQPDGGVVEGDWDGAYSKATWDKLCPMLEDPSRKTTHRLRNYLLTGLIFDTQSRALISRYRATLEGGTRLYRTPTSTGGGGVTIKAEDVESLVVEAVLRVTDELVIPEPETDQTPASEAIQAQLDELAEMWGRGDLTAGEWNAARGPLQARLADARQSERKRPGIADMEWGSPGLLREKWDGLTIQQQRTAVEAFVERVVVAPVGDGQRVSVTWRA